MASSSSSAPARSVSDAPSAGRIRPPVLRVTAYDRVSSLLMALLLAALGVVVVTVGWWLTTRPPPAPAPLVALEIVDVTGGYEDGSPDETLRVDSPEEERPNASLVNNPTEESTPQVEAAIANVISASGKATAPGAAGSASEYMESADVESTGVPGSARGTGGRPLGMGGGTTGGVPREMRWYVKFSDTASVDEYARQLDFFKIELGVLSADGVLTYVSNLSAGQPQRRQVNSGKDEKRLFFRWQGGERKGADETLLAKAGVTVGNGTIFHFYSRETENILATLEAQYTRRPLKEVRRTYFNVVRRDKNYEFVVTRQTFLR